MDVGLYEQFFEKAKLCFDEVSQQHVVNVNDNDDKYSVV